MIGVHKIWLYVALDVREWGLVKADCPGMCAHMLLDMQCAYTCYYQLLLDGNNSCSLDTDGVNVDPVKFEA